MGIRMARWSFCIDLGCESGYIVKMAEVRLTSSLARYSLSAKVCACRARKFRHAQTCALELYIQGVGQRAVSQSFHLGLSSDAT